MSPRALFVTDPVERTCLTPALLMALGCCAYPNLGPQPFGTPVNFPLTN